MQIDNRLIVSGALYDLKSPYLAALLPEFPLALSSLRLLLLSNGFSIVGLADGRVESATALLWHALKDEVAPDAGLLMALLYRLRNEVAADEDDVSITWN